MMCRALITAVLLLALSACAASATLAPVQVPASELPAPSTLDDLRGASAEQQVEVDITAPYVNQHTTVVEESLEFTSTASELAYAIYQIDASQGELLLSSSGYEGDLWLLAAEYGSGCWIWDEDHGEGIDVINLSEMEDYTSTGGFSYLAVVCPLGQTGRLDDLALLIDTEDPFNLTATPYPEAPPCGTIVLEWNSGLADSFELYRSTIPDDPAPYLVYAGDDELVGNNMWIEFAPPDVNDGTWLPAEDDNETPTEESDDFPRIAPEVDYYYHLVPYIGGEAQPCTDEVHTLLPWGDKRTTRRMLPSTRSDIHVFADQLIPGSMSLQQVQWCAENLVGTQKAFKSQADEFRAYNLDFMVLGYHLGNGAGNIGNIHGMSWDPDADWPYVDAHDSWFLTITGSTQPEERILQQNWNWYVADPNSNWQHYLAANLLQMLGENHFDGWFVDSCHQPWNTDPAKWWPGQDTSQAMFAYFTPKLHAMLRTVTQTAQTHPLQPYIIPNAGSYITTLSDIKYYGADWACDGIMIEGHAHNAPSNYFSEEDWILQHDRILDHQANGLATILQTDIFTLDTDDRLFVLASYLLVRGEHTYINWLGDDGQDTINPSIGQWYPEFDIDEDEGFPWDQPVGPDPTTMADLYREDLDLYRRSYTSGFVIVNPSDTAVVFDTQYHMLRLTVTGGGNVTAAGEKQGFYDWEGINGEYTMDPHTAMVILDVFG